MAQIESSREALEHQAHEALTTQTEQQKYVERPRYQRVLAWILVGVVLAGTLLMYAWMVGLLK